MPQDIGDARDTGKYTAIQCKFFDPSTDKDGYQRFTYPDSRRSLVEPKPLRQRRSITIPLLVPESDPPKHLLNLVHATHEESTNSKRRKPQPIKHAQTYPYKSKAWRDAYGMRNLVETSNNLLKLASEEDLGNARKRSGRGFAFTYLASALASASSNLKRMVTFFEAEAKRASEPAQRTSRRTDEHGEPLRQPNAPGKASPPH